MRVHAKNAKESRKGRKITLGFAPFAPPLRSLREMLYG